jgi:signal transduction histidine kinase
MTPVPSRRLARPQAARGRFARPWVYAAALGIALLALAALQYRWTGEVSRLERERLGRATDAALQRFALDFDRLLAELARAFLGVGLDELPAARQRWQADAPYPDLLREILIEDTQGGLRRLDPESGSLHATGQPPQTPASATALQPPRGSTPWPPFSVSSHPPAVVLAAPRRPELRAGDSTAPGAIRAVLLRLDLVTLREEVLPDLGAEAFGAPDLEQDLWVIDGSDGKVLWTNDRDDVAGAPANAPRVALGHAGALQPLHERLREHLHGPPPGIARRPYRWRGTNETRRPPRVELEARSSRRGESPGTAPWLLVAQHPAGSLDRAVARLRARNLGVSLSVLALLGASGALLLLAARRAEDTARRQAEWVAGLTHELHTPLAALSAAGENLADGVITTPGKVREYGELIRREGRRLQELVAQALALARLDGLQRAAIRTPAEAVSLREVVERAIAQRELELRQSGGSIEIEFEDDLPAALGRSEALERVVGNLIDNALKHGGGRVWVLAARSGESALALTVADGGPGFPEAERDAVFEPYFRGAGARRNGVPGAGLGLHLVRRLVEEMRGTIEVLPAGAAGLPPDARGAAFRVELPRAPRPAEEAS